MQCGVVRIVLTLLLATFLILSVLLYVAADCKGRDGIIKRNEQYTFHKACTRIFATFEANSEVALPLFIDEIAQEVRHFMQNMAVVGTLSSRCDCEYSCRCV